MDNLTPGQDPASSGHEQDATAASGSPSPSGVPEATARVQVLARKSGIKFVNDMRNMLWITGGVGALDDSTILLSQTNNPETSIRIKIDPKKYSPKKLNGRLLTFQAHVRGYRDEHGPQLQVNAFDIDRPSLLDLPSEKVWMSGFGKDPKRRDLLKKIAVNERIAFSEDGIVKPEYREFFLDVGEDGRATIEPEAFAFVQAFRMFGDAAEASGGVIDSRIGNGQNYCTVAGLVDAKAFVPENKYRRGYGLILLRQHEDSNADLPIRVTDSRAQRFFSSRYIYEGAPLVINGSVRRKVYPRDDSPAEIASAHTYIEVSNINDIKPAVYGQDILRAPTWWAEITNRMHARREAQRAAAAAAANKRSTGGVAGILDDDFVAV